MNKEERTAIWNVQYGAMVKSGECKGCFQNIIHKDRYKGWEASHIWAKAKGGPAQLYNIYALCAVCNGQMGTNNMFVYFHKLRNYAALNHLLEHLRMVYKRNHPTLWENCGGQMFQLIQRFFLEHHSGDGGISPDDPVLVYILEQDIKVNDRAALDAKREYLKLEERSLESRKLWEKIKK